AQKIMKHQWAWDSSEVNKGIKSILSTFAWSTCGYYNEPARTYEDYLSLLKGFVQEDPTKVLQQLQVKVDDELTERAELLKRLPEAVRRLEHPAAESGYLKDFMKFASNEMVYRSEPLFAAIAQVTGRSADELKNLMPEEVVALLKG